MKEKLINYIPAISRVISNATPILLLLILTKFINSNELGVINYFISIITLIGVGTDLGLPEAFQRFIFLAKDKKQLIYSTLVFELFLSFIGATLFFIINLFNNNNLSLGIRNSFLLFLIIIFSSSNTIILIFNGLQKRFITSIYFLISSLIFLSTTIILFIFSKDIVLSFLIGRFLSFMIFTFIPIYNLYRSNQLTYKFSLSKRYLVFAVNSLITNISYNLFNQWDSILIPAIIGFRENGIYKSVAFLATLPYALNVTLQTKLLPQYSQLFHLKQFINIKISINKYIKILILLNLILFVLAVIFGHLALKIIFNPEISENGYDFFIILFTSTLIYILSGPITSALLAIGKENISRNISIFQCLGFIVISTLLLGKLGLFLLPLLSLCLNIIFLIATYLSFNRSIKYLMENKG